MKRENSETKVSVQEMPEPPKTPAAPKRISVTNTNPANGTIGTIAKPLAKDVAQWTANGWTVAK